jgi:CheY-like chemotaxis protein
MNPEDAADILFVEDNPFDVELTLRTLRRSGFHGRVVVAADGADALDFITASGRYAHRKGAPLPKLILLDLKLPTVSGLYVLQGVRADPHARNVPVVVLTSSESDRDVIEAHKLGVAAYVVKPLEREEFLRLARDLGLPGAAPREIA